MSVGTLLDDRPRPEGHRPPRGTDAAGDGLAIRTSGLTKRFRARAVVDGLMRSLATGFVYVTHDVSSDLIDEAYALLEQFFTLPAEAKARFVAPGTHGQTGYTGLLVETAGLAPDCVLPPRCRGLAVSFDREERSQDAPRAVGVAMVPLEAPRRARRRGSR